MAENRTPKHIIEEALRGSRKEQLAHGHDWDVADAVPAACAAVEEILARLGMDLMTLDDGYFGKVAEGKFPTLLDSSEVIDKIQALRKELAS